MLTSGQLGLANLRYVVAGGMDGAWAIFEGLGTALTYLARPLELSVARNVETASRSERVQCTAWAHLARDRGNLHLIKDEIIKVNQGRLRRCVTYQITQFADRKKPRGSLAGRLAYGRNIPQKRSESRQRFGSSQRATKRRTTNRGQSPYVYGYKRSPKKGAKEPKAETRERKLRCRGN